MTNKRKGSGLTTFDQREATTVTGSEQTPDLLDQLLGVPSPARAPVPGPAAPPAEPPPPEASAIQLSHEPAWYVDPTDPNVMRRWDGTRWTGDVMLVNPPPPAPAEPSVGAVTPMVQPREKDPEVRVAGDYARPAGQSPDAPAVPPVEVTGPAEPGPARPVLAEPQWPGPAPAGPEAAAPASPAEPEVDPAVVGDTSSTAGTLSIMRGPYYVLAPLAVETTAPVPSPHDGVITLVTGEVPPEYDRVTIECADGSTVEASIMEQRLVRDRNLFVALVHHRIVRVVATRLHGAQGVFVDVSLLSKSSG